MATSRQQPIPLSSRASGIQRNDSESKLRSHGLLETQNTITTFKIDYSRRTFARGVEILFMIIIFSMLSRSDYHAFTSTVWGTESEHVNLVFANIFVWIVNLSQCGVILFGVFMHLLSGWPIRAIIKTELIMDIVACFSNLLMFIWLVATVHGGVCTSYNVVTAFHFLAIGPWGWNVAVGFSGLRDMKNMI